MTFKFPERHRFQMPYPFNNTDPDGGAFQSRGPVAGRPLNMIASKGEAWEHVSVTIKGQPDKTPTWVEMCFVKDLFWDPEDIVMQLHPPRSKWINNHAGCLHLWRPIGQTIPLPPGTLVGWTDLTPEQIGGMTEEERNRVLTDRLLDGPAS